MRLELEWLSDNFAMLGESPALSRDGSFVWWVDIEGHAVLRSEVSTGATQRWPAPEPAGCIAERDDGVILVGMATGIFRFDPEGGGFERLCNPQPEPGLRFNDGALDPDGRFWLATMGEDPTEERGVLFVLDRDYAWRRLAEGLRIANGLAFDPTRGRLYLSDSHPGVQTIWCYDWDRERGEIGDARVFARTDELPGRPDGAFVDATGIYWICGVEGGEIMRFTPEGARLPSLSVPVSHPTKAVLSRDGRSLFLTSRRMAPASAQHLSGHLMCLRVVD